MEDKIKNTPKIRVFLMAFGLCLFFLYSFSKSYYIGVSGKIQVIIKLIFTHFVLFVFLHVI
jgi:hypothetical protein